VSEDQRVEQAWETPSHDEIVELTKMHVGAMEVTDDDLVWVQAGMHHVLLHTIGRRSGTEHKVALPTWKDPDGHRIIVASFAGAPGNPSWFWNLADREANPRVRCRVQGGQFWSEHEILEGDERDRLWDLLVADRAWYADYQARTDRTIPLVRLPESEAIPTD
jgi:deazaflavin-dependent oxidoreductase (nitroreductase family)